MDILQSGAFAALLSAIGAALRPLFLTIRIGIEAVELLVGENVVTASLRNALNDFETWLNVTLSDQLRQGILATIAELSSAAGFPLDPSDPFSAESLTGAVNARLGTQFEDVTDKDSVREELKRIAAEKVSEAIGYEITDIENADEWAGFAGSVLVQGARGELEKFPREAVCPALNAVLGEFCRTQVCHECMDDFDDCVARRQRQQDNRDKTERDCKRRPKR